jgi:hypothetical protein
VGRARAGYSFERRALSRRVGFRVGVRSRGVCVFFLACYYFTQGVLSRVVRSCVVRSCVATVLVRRGCLRAGCARARRVCWRGVRVLARARVVLSRGLSCVQVMLSRRVRFPSGCACARRVLSRGA